MAAWPLSSVLTPPKNRSLCGSSPRFTNKLRLNLVNRVSALSGGVVRVFIYIYGSSWVEFWLVVLFLVLSWCPVLMSCPGVLSWCPGVLMPVFTSSSSIYYRHKLYNKDLSNPNPIKLMEFLKFRECIPITEHSSVFIITLQPVIL